MFTRLVSESFVRNPRRKILTAAAVALGMAVATATLTVALEVGDRMAREFRSLGANLLVTPESDTLPLEIGGVDYRPVDEGAYIDEAQLGKLKTIFWRHNILGFTPFLDVRAVVDSQNVTMVGTWYEHDVPVPDGTKFKTGLSATHPYWKVEGRWFHDGANEAVVGAALAAKNPRTFAIGKRIDARGANAVSGITNGAPSAGASDAISLEVTGVASTGDARDNAVLVPLSVAQRISGHPGQIRQLFVSALTKPADALAARDPHSLTPTEYDRWFCSPYISSISYQIEQVLPGTDVHAIRRVAETEGRVLSQVSTLLWIVTIAALVAAGLAVGAMAASTVLDRRGEIGIMKAIGATNFTVAALFLAEQLMLAMGGGILGFALGAVMARALGENVFGAPAEPRMVLLPIVLGLAAVVAVAGSFIPLWQAARFNPAPVLRGE